MSRTHPGESIAYQHKKDVRSSREFERMKLKVATMKYFDTIGEDYEALMKTAAGAMKVKTLKNRSKIKTIKGKLDDEEVICFMECLSPESNECRKEG